MPHVENDRSVKYTNEARAGVTGHNVRYVLLIGTLAVSCCLRRLMLRRGGERAFREVLMSAPGFVPALCFYG
ncbi:MAG: hypothetical protein WCB52_19335 [Pseudolabrys sp.]